MRCLLESTLTIPPANSPSGSQSALPRTPVTTSMAVSSLHGKPGGISLTDTGEEPSRVDVAMARLRHDLRGDLQAMSNSLHQLGANEKGTSEFDQGLAQALHTIGHICDRLIRQEPRVIDLAQFVAANQDFLAHQCAPIQLHVLAEAVGALPIRVVPAELRDALANLVRNARDACAAGGTISVSLRALEITMSGGTPPSGRFAVVEVCDTGVGMDAATLSVIGQPWVTTKAPGKGSGLGLSGVRGFAQDIGAKMHLASEPGKGTSVNLQIPLLEASATHGTHTPAARGGTAPKGAWFERRIARGR